MRSLIYSMRLVLKFMRYTKTVMKSVGFSMRSLIYSMWSVCQFMRLVRSSLKSACLSMTDLIEKRSELIGKGTDLTTVKVRATGF